MAVPIYILGKSQDYTTIKTDENSIKNVFLRGGFRVLSGKGILDYLQDDSSISARNFIYYGLAQEIKTSVERKETMPVGLGNFFENIITYAEDHGAEQVALQNLQIDYSRGVSEISGLVQLLINK